MSPPTRMRKHFFYYLLLAAAAMAVTVLPLSFAPQPDIPVAWLAAGLTVGATLRWGRGGLASATLGVALGGAVAGYGAEGAVVFGTANLVLGMVVGIARAHSAAVIHPLGRLRQVAWLAGVAGLLGSLASTAALMAAGGLAGVWTARPDAMDAAAWLLAGLAGVLTVAPLFLAGRLNAPTRLSWVEYGLVSAILLLMTLHLFMGGALGLHAGPVRPYMLVFGLLWIALRFSIAGAAPVLATLAVLAAVVRMSPASPLDEILFLTGPPYPLQGFLLMCALTTLFLAVLLEERLAAAERGRRSNERYRGLVENIRGWIWETDDQDRFTYSSPQVERLLGYPAAEVVGRTLYDFMEPGEADRVRRLSGSCEGNLLAYSARVRAKGGGEVFLDTSCTRTRDTSGRVTGHMGISRDVTARVKAELDRDIANRRFELLASQVRELFWIASPESRPLRFVYLSPAVEHVLGRSAEELLSSPDPLRLFVHPDDLERVLAPTETLLAGGSAEVEHRCVHPDGEVRWIRARAFPATDARGSRLACGIAEDITHHKEAVARREVRREALIREVHHRIKNNLQSVVGLLRLQAGRTPELAPHLEAAVTQVQSIALVHGLQGRSGQGTVPVRDLLTDLAGSVAGLTGADIALDRGEAAIRDDWLVENEAVAVALILNELLLNAVKHARDSAHRRSVRIVVEDGEAALRIRIANAGTLPPGFDFGRGAGLGTGLDLVRSLLAPKGMRLEYARAGDRVLAELILSAPVLSGIAVPPSCNHTEIVKIRGDADHAQ